MAVAITVALPSRGGRQLDAVRAARLVGGRHRGEHPRLALRRLGGGRAARRRLPPARARPAARDGARVRRRHRRSTSGSPSRRSASPPARDSRVPLADLISVGFGRVGPRRHRRARRRADDGNDERLPRRRREARRVARAEGALPRWLGGRRRSAASRGGRSCVIAVVGVVIARRARRGLQQHRRPRARDLGVLHRRLRARDRLGDPHPRRPRPARRRVALALSSCSPSSRRGFSRCRRSPHSSRSGCAGRSFAQILPRPFPRCSYDRETGRRPASSHGKTLTQSKSRSTTPACPTRGRPRGCSLWIGRHQLGTLALGSRLRHRLDARPGADAVRDRPRDPARHRRPRQPARSHAGR